MSDTPYVDPDNRLRTHRDGHVSVITFNTDCFNAGTMASLRAAILALQNLDEQTRAIVLSGTEHFCVGTDLTELGAQTDVMTARNQQFPVTKFFRELHSGSKPIVCAVEGQCVGPGLALACASDLIVAGESSRFCCDYARLGMLPGLGLLWSLPQKVGAGLARKLMLDARVFDAADAFAWGMLSEVVADGQALSSAVKQAAQIGGYPPATVALLKAATVYGMSSVEDAWREEIDLNPLVRITADHTEAVTAFMEKRAPVFSGD